MSRPDEHVAGALRIGYERLKAEVAALRAQREADAKTVARCAELANAAERERDALCAELARVRAELEAYRAASWHWHDEPAAVDGAKLRVNHLPAWLPEPGPERAAEPERGATERAGDVCATCKGEGIVGDMHVSSFWRTCHDCGGSGRAR